MSRYLSIIVAALSLIVSFSVHAREVGSKDIKKGAIESKHIARNQVKSSDIKNGGIQSKDIKDGGIRQQDLEPSMVESFLNYPYEYVDSIGNVVGPMMLPDLALLEVTPENVMPGTPNVPVNVGDLHALFIARDFINPDFPDSVQYTEDNCAGEAWMYSYVSIPSAVPFVAAGVLPGTASLAGFRPDTTVPYENKTMESYWGVDHSVSPPTVGCLDMSNAVNAYRAVPVVDVSGFVAPFAVRKVQ